MVLLWFIWIKKIKNSNELLYLDIEGKGVFLLLLQKVTWQGCRCLHKRWMKNEQGMFHIKHASIWYLAAVLAWRLWKPIIELRLLVWWYLAVLLIMKVNYDWPDRGNGSTSALNSPSSSSAGHGSWWQSESISSRQNWRVWVQEMVQCF